MKRINVPVEQKEWLSLAEFADAAGVSKTAVSRWIKGGYLDATRYSPKCIMLRRGELECYLRGEMMERHRIRTTGEEADKEALKC
ncbi:MAG: hypothetical protein LBK08_05875 [Treponema sp.]|jgi:predicted DNA-binding protein YlxM (UPF0122 family)|nr:hypothetical protein [Treponema sp.]